VSRCLKRAKLAVVLARAILAAVIGGVVSTAPGQAESSLPDVPTLCSALSLAEAGAETVDNLARQAGDEIATMDARLLDCGSRPLCAYSPERDALEARAREAQRQLADLSRLRTVMLDHKRAILEQMRVETEDNVSRLCRTDR